MSARLPPPPREIDLDSTDELPMLRGPLLEERLSATDDFGVAAVTAGTGELAGRLREMERRLEQREDRIVQLEASIGDALARELALRAELDKERFQAFDHARDSGQHLEDAERELVTVRTEFERREADHLAAQVEIDAQRRALAHARMEVEQRAHAFRHQAMDLAELRSRSERLHEAVQTALGWRADDQQQMAALEAQRDGLRRQVEALRGSPNPPTAFVREEEQQSRILQLQAELARLEGQVAQLGRELAEAQRLLAGREEELAAASERVAGLEAALREQAGRMEHGQDVHDTQDIIVTADEAQAATEDSGTRPGLRALQEGQDEDSGTRPALHELVLGKAEAPLRVLLRMEGGEEVRYALGRRTTIGRTPDNDIQIDTNYISRHHAVVLSNAQDCIVEDLNSTNGVLVNGRRVGRHSLRDGDSLLVGNTVFTFQQSE